MQQESISDDVSSTESKPVLILANGKQVLPDGRVVSVREVPKPAAQFSREVQSGRAASRTLERIHRKLGDLPDVPMKMNPIAAIMSYTAIGLNDADIATALGASEQQVKTIKESELYKQFADLFDKTVFEDSKRAANHIVAKASTVAAERMVSAIDSEDESVAVVASREVMKLAGVGVDRVDESKVSGLSIKIVRSGDKKNDEVTVTLGA